VSRTGRSGTRSGASRSGYSRYGRSRTGSRFDLEANIVFEDEDKSQKYCFTVVAAILALLVVGLLAWFVIDHLNTETKQVTQTSTEDSTTEHDVQKTDPEIKEEEPKKEDKKDEKKDEKNENDDEKKKNKGKRIDENKVDPTPNPGSNWKAIACKVTGVALGLGLLYWGYTSFFGGPAVDPSLDAEADRKRRQADLERQQRETDDEAERQRLKDEAEKLRLEQETAERLRKQQEEEEARKPKTEEIGKRWSADGTSGLKQCQVYNMKGEKISDQCTIGNDEQVVNGYLSKSRAPTKGSYTLKNGEKFELEAATGSINIPTMSSYNDITEEATPFHHHYHYATDGKKQMLCELESKVHKVESDTTITEYDDVSNIIRCGTKEDWLDDGWGMDGDVAGPKSWYGDNRNFRGWMNWHNNLVDRMTSAEPRTNEE